MDHNDLIMCGVFLRENKRKKGSKSLCEVFKKMTPSHVDCLTSSSLITTLSTYTVHFPPVDLNVFERKAVQIMDFAV